MNTIAAFLLRLQCLPHHLNRPALMKKNILFALLLLCTGPVLAEGLGQRFHATAKLPADSAIWPLDKTNSPIVAECTFQSETTLLWMAQGNWNRAFRYLTYTVDNVTRGTYPHRQITFLYLELCPTGESGILLKTPVHPFRKKNMTFFMERDPTCRVEEFFLITSYSSE